MSASASKAAGGWQDGPLSLLHLSCPPARTIQLKCMPQARIVARSAEESQEVASQLRARGFEIVSAQPGIVSNDAVDLEVRVEECAPEEALLRAGALSEFDDRCVFIATGAIAGVLPIATIPFVPEPAPLTSQENSAVAPAGISSSESLDSQPVTTLHENTGGAMPHFLTSASPLPDSTTSENVSCSQGASEESPRVSEPPVIKAPPRGHAPHAIKVAVIHREGMAHKAELRPAKAGTSGIDFSVAKKARSVAQMARSLRNASVRLMVFSGQYAARQSKVVSAKSQIAIRGSKATLRQTLDVLQRKKVGLRQWHYIVRTANRLKQPILSRMDQALQTRRLASTSRSDVFFWKVATGCAALAVFALLIGPLAHRRAPVPADIVHRSNQAEQQVPFAPAVTKHADAKIPRSTIKPAAQTIPAGALVGELVPNAEASPSTVASKASLQRGSRESDEVVVRYFGKKSTPPTKQKSAQNSSVKHYSDLD